MSRRGAAVRRVVVAGDVTVDWHLARRRAAGGDGASGSAPGAARLAAGRGGAALLADLVGAALPGPAGAFELHGPPAPDLEAARRDSHADHSFALWSEHPAALGGRGAGEPDAWRVEELLGLDRGTGPLPAAGRGGEGGPPSAELVVVEDGGRRFRAQPAAWPRALAAGRARWILLAMADPVASGPLWERLAGFADRLVVVLTVEDLRRSEVQVSRDLSWERTAQDLGWELVHNLRVSSLAGAARVVVSLGTAGALLLGRGPDGAVESRLLFDPLHTEGSWEAAHPGGTLGGTSCLTASIARQLLLAPERPDLELAVQRGVAAMRRLHRQGYLGSGAAGGELELAFPLQGVAAELAGDERPLAVVAIRDPLRGPLASGAWTILEERFPHGLDRLAEEIVLAGPEAAIAGVPIGRFGDLVTVDRSEIESFRAVGALIEQYLATAGAPPPLSIAVFGAPGSGKSFGVAQVARSLAGGRMANPLTFNLSQMQRPEELVDALHQVRDVGLEGRVPLVFWDEFDASPGGRPLGWLAHFLAPMQDGRFQEGQVNHPIGRAVFVFAGGTRSSLRDFTHREEADRDLFQRVKGPDFVSRIKGFVDVLGPNPRGGDAAADPFFVVRRAILLRSLLRRRHPALFAPGPGGGRLRIDPGVLRALLGVGRYEHGARSMESLVAMSRLAGRRAFERSALPSEVQLDLHVDGRQFLALVQRIALEGALLEGLAAAVHEVYGAAARDGGRTRGRAAAPTPFAELPEDEREQCRGNARDIPEKLATAGYVMLPARSNAPPFHFPESELERLAELEHERWMAAKLAAGWRWERATDKDRRLHRDLVPWAALDDGEHARRYGEAADRVGRAGLSAAARDKDRELVRAIPRILARIGYTVVPTRSAPA